MASSSEDEGPFSDGFRSAGVLMLDGSPNSDERPATTPPRSTHTQPRPPSAPDSPQLDDEQAEINAAVHMMHERALSTAPRTRTITPPQFQLTPASLDPGPVAEYPLEVTVEVDEGEQPSLTPCTDGVALASSALITSAAPSAYVSAAPSAATDAGAAKTDGLVAPRRPTFTLRRDKTHERLARAKASRTAPRETRMQPTAGRVRLAEVSSSAPSEAQPCQSPSTPARCRSSFGQAIHPMRAIMPSRGARHATPCSSTTRGAAGAAASSGGTPPTIQMLDAVSSADSNLYEEESPHVIWSTSDRNTNPNEVSVHISELSEDFI